VHVCLRIKSNIEEDNVPQNMSRNEGNLQTSLLPDDCLRDVYSLLESIRSFVYSSHRFSSSKLSFNSTSF
jgi:hypothetical protein